MSAHLTAIDDLRAECWDGGWRPLAVLSHDHPDREHAGKKPLGPDWPGRARMDPPEAVTLPAVAHAANTGLLCDGVRNIDIDVDDKPLAARLRALSLEMLGDTVVRYRDNSGRLSLPYRAAEGSPKKRVLAGKLGTIEVLGHGQQFVAYGIHPSGAELRWFPTGPAQMPLDQIPAVTEEQITAFLVACAPLIEADHPADEPKANGQDGPHVSTEDEAEILDVMAALAVVPNTGPANWEAWNNVGMATWRASLGSQQGFNAWDAWSAKHPSYDADACFERWKHYPKSPPDQTGAGKLYAMAVKAMPGWQRPSETRRKAEANKNPTGPALWVDDDDWTEADIPCRPWVVPGYALRGSVTVLCGPPSAMKSSVTLAWGCSLALHHAFGRFRPLNEGKMLVYNVEDDKLEQRRRLSATLRQFPGTPASIKGKIIRTGPEQIGTLLTRGEDGTIVFTAAMGKLEDLIRDQTPDVLVCDPLAELHNCEENDNNALRAIIAEFRRIAVLYNIAVIILHHTRKGSSTTPGDPDVARGASAIIGAARIVLTITGMSEDDAKSLGLPTDPVARSHYVRMDDAKANYTALRNAEWFEKLAYTLDNGEQVAAAVPWTPPAAKVASQSDLAAIATAIEKGSPSGEPWSPKLSKDARSVRALLEQFGFIGDAQKQVMVRLQSECAVQTGQWRTAKKRHPVGGLHIDHKPTAVEWLDDAGDSE